jgi:hypothetical protein
MKFAYTMQKSVESVGCVNIYIAGHAHLNAAQVIISTQTHHINSDQPAFEVMLDFVACAFSCDIRPPQSTGNRNRCVSSDYSWRKLIRMQQVITSTQTIQLLELCLILWFVHAHEISDPHNQPAIGIDVCHLIIAGESSFECGRSSYQLRPTSFWSYA